MSPARRPSRRRAFADTWWGRAWVEALEDRARLDPNRLPRGRTYARQARVEDLDVEPGWVMADVQGRRPWPYEVTVRVRMFDAEEWDAALDAIAGRAAHAAAMLDGELDPGIVDDLASAHIELLPGAGELGPSCSCPDWADPCKHAAAVCYLVARLLDHDPFVLFLLRGRGRDELLAELRRRRSRANGNRLTRSRGTDHNSGGDPVSDPGMPARDLLASGPAEGLRLPEVPRPGRRAQRPAPPPVALPVERGDTAALLDLATDAAERAWELATGQGDGGMGLDTRADLARRAARLSAAQSPFRDLATRSGTAPRALLTSGLAWRQGGVDGVTVLHEKWPIPAEDRAEARTALSADAPPGARMRADANRVSRSDGVQLRFGRDGRWYPYRKQIRGIWEPAGPPHPDPAQALADME